MKSAVTKRSISLGGHKTSVSLEREFWEALRTIAAERGVSTAELIGEIDRSRSSGNLSSCIRLFVYADAQIKLKALAEVGDAPALAPHAGNNGVASADPSDSVVLPAHRQ